MFYIVGVPKYFAEFAGKHLCWNHFLILLQTLRRLVLYFVEQLEITTFVLLCLLR